jgi:serine/threonine protein kinase
MSLRDFLQRHDLLGYADTCDRMRLSIRDLGEMSDDDLIEVLGMSRFMDRRKLRVALAATPSAPESPPVPVDDGSTRVGTPTGAAAAFPQQLGSYRVLGIVGAGGMGTVVRARHLEEAWALQQGGDVAIKLIHPHIATSPAFRRRFMQEAALGRRVQHAGLVSTWDVIVEGAWLGTVMSLVQGEPLAARLREGGVGVDAVVKLLEPVGEVLDFLHAQGIVHRDVKPANIVLRTNGTPVLLDLGIAKDTAAPDSRTRTMVAMGTSEWMAPEQADAKHVDGAADRYALGLLAYALLSGRMPWDHGTSEARVLAHKLMGQLAPLDTVVREVPAHVAAAVTQMLSTEPEARHPTCEAFIAALRGTTRARDPGSTSRASTQAVAGFPAVAPPGPSASWHYAGADGVPRTLPVADVVAAVRGAPRERHLLWRDGMAAWSDWSAIPEVVAAVGPVEATPPPLPARPREHLDELDASRQVQAPEPPPAAEPDPNRPLTMKDLVTIYDDPRGLVLHRSKVGNRWFATQADPYTGQPQTFELRPAEISQLKAQLAGSPYWVLGAVGPGGP